MPFTWENSWHRHFSAQNICKEGILQLAPKGAEPCNCQVHKEKESTHAYLADVPFRDKGKASGSVVQGVKGLQAR